jgi:hypothetical protein
MTPERFQVCLTALRWTDHGLAATLECDLLLVEAWADGVEPIPASLAAWLETLAQCHEAAPPPTTWRGKRYRG